LSSTLAGDGRTGGKLGLTIPTLTLPLSSTLGGDFRIGGKLGLTIPIRTLPLSVIWEVEVFTTRFIDVFSIEASNS
jgi:hypothetical protein